MLPAYRVNPMLDLSPISNALTGYQQQMNTNDQLSMRDRQVSMQEKEFDDAQKQRAIDRMGRISDAALNEKDPVRRAAMMGALYKMHPEMPAKLQEQGLRPDDHMGVATFLKAQTSTYDPLGEKTKLAQIAASQASTAHSVASERRAQTQFDTGRQQFANMTPEQRRAAAPSLGFTPGTPEHQQFIITGTASPNAGMTDDIKEFDYAKRNGFVGSFTDWMKQKKDMGNNAAQQVTWGRDAQGNWVAMQATRGGELLQSKLPNGVTPVPVPELAEAKAAATQRGEAAGKAQVDLPGVEARATSMKAALDAVEAGITQNPRMTGWSGNLPNVSPTARDVQAKIDQVQGKVFLQAFDALRGAGAITETEGAQAKAALSRLQETRVGTPEYLAAIADVRKEIDALVNLSRTKARGSAPPPSPSSGGWSIRKLD